ncbi:MAG: hypothetical protein JRG80_02515 [Deltaproteobacteria bacterium]|nr:hypothetical protein [Deltaproteobacteria bacterium]MBW2398126.1 hypothetical protein [Deltaproteobacteria bacterium]
MTDQPLDQRRRAAQCLRELVHEITTADADDGDFAAIAAALEPLRDRLASSPRITLAVDGLHCFGRIERVDGRKVFCNASLDAAGTVVAEAEGVYLRVDPNRY